MASLIRYHVVEVSQIEVAARERTDNKKENERSDQQGKPVTLLLRVVWMAEACSRFHRLKKVH